MTGRNPLHAQHLLVKIRLKPDQIIERVLLRWFLRAPNRFGNPLHRVAVKSLQRGLQ